MDTIFIWLIGGAAIGLLGIFLVASERELKRKRRELEELKHQLADAPVPGISSASADVFSQEQGASAELMARNKDLLEEISSLSKKLEASESRLEQMETLRAHLNSKESEITELRWERERLQSELAAQKTSSAPSNEFATESAPPNESATDEAMQNAQKDAEIAALKEQLEASQAKTRDLESAQIQPAAAESGNQAFEELQRSLEVSTLQLQNALAAEQEKQKALEATQFQLAEMQQRHHELSTTNLRLQEENSQHQQKLTNQNHLQVERLVILRQRLEQLRLKQAEVSQQESLIQEEILSMSQLLDVVPQSTRLLELSNATPDDRDSRFDFKRRDTDDAAYAETADETLFKAPAAEPHTLYHDGSTKTNGISAEPQNNHATNLTTAIAAVTQRSDELSPSGLKKKKRFGIFYTAIGVFVVGGALAVGFLGKDSEQKAPAPQPKVEARSTPSGFATANAKPRPAPATPEQRDGGAVDRATLATPDDARITKPAEKATTALLSSGKPPSMAWESYEVIQPTRVFSAPRADSQLIANIEPGTEVNVVDSRDGWLEIRSKHGRPPGFIRKDAAVRIGSN